MAGLVGLKMHGSWNSNSGINLLKPKTYYMYRQFDIQQFYVLPTQTVFMCFVWI